MHDKEFSYSNLVDNLNEYEEVPECEFVTTLPNIDYVLHDNSNKKVMSKLSHEKQEMVTERDRQQHEQKQIKRSFRKVVDSIVNGTDYHKIVAMVGEYDEPRS
jgi:dGTP triphosphohydrolase